MATVVAGRLVIEVDTNARRASREVEKLGKSTERAGKQASGANKAFNALKNIGIAAIALRAARAIGKLAAETVRLASDAEETRNKFSVVFRGISDEAQSAATNLASNFGLAQTTAQALLADTGDLLTGFGFTREGALDLSTQVQELAVDLASFTNFSGGAEGASQALTKALLGERESIKTLGIAITEADIQRLAEDKGIVGELTRQQKAALTLELAIQQSGNAIGDFERSQASFANQVRIAEARIQDQKTAIGQALLPFANLAVTAFNNLGSGVADAADSINEFIRSAEGAQQIGRIFGTVAGAVGVLGEAYKVVLGTLREGLQPAFEQIKEVLSGFRGEGESSGIVFKILGNVLQGLVAGVSLFGVSLNATITNIRNFVEAVRQSAQAVGSAFRVFSREVTFRDVRREFEEAGQAFATLGTGFVEGIGDVASEIRDQIGSFTDGAEDNADRLLEAFQRNAERIGETVTTTLQASTDAAVAASEEAATQLDKQAAEAQALADEQARLAKALATKRAAFEAKYTQSLFEQSATRVELLEQEAAQALKIAKELGADTAAVNAFFAEEIRRARVEEEREANEEIERERREAQERLNEIASEQFAALAEDAKRRVAAETAALREIGEARRAAAEEAVRIAAEAAEKQKAIEEAQLTARTQIVDAYFGFVSSLIENNIQDERKAAIAKKAISIAEATINTARAIIGFLADPGGIPGTILAAAAGVTGALQIGTIAATPIPAAQFGGSFQVPPGNNNDSGLVRVNSGEQVDISPARGGGGQPIVVKLQLGQREFVQVVEDAFNKGGAQIRNPQAVRTR